MLVCTAGHWERREAFPAPCFACGDRQCLAGARYCDVSYSDIAGEAPAYECVAYPIECRSAPTCACLTPLIAADNCTEGALAGSVTVEHFGG